LLANSCDAEVTRAITKTASTTTTAIDSGLRLTPIAVAQDTCLFHPCHGQAASDSATRTVDSLGGPAKYEHVKTVKCCVKQKAQQGGVEN
jgi:hypothetical protein